MKRFAKLIAAALAGLTLALCLIACNGGNKPDTPDTPKGFTPSLDPETACTIHIVGHYSNFEALEAEFDRFQEYYPNVELVYTYLDNYNGVIPTALGGAEAPDIFFTYPWMIDREDVQPIFQVTEDLSDPALGIDLECLRPGLIYRDKSGAVSMVPIFCTTYGMMVNEDIFAKEGLAVPTTYEDLLLVCDALQKAGYANPMMGYNRGTFLTFPLFYPYFCAEILGNETAIAEMNRMDPAAGKYMRGALELAVDFMNHGYINLEECNTLENDYNAVIMRFFEGDIPMMLASGNTVSGTEKRQAQSEAYAANPFAYSFHPVPSTEDGGYFFITVSLSFSVNKNSPNLDMANEFMRFLVSPTELGMMAQSKRMVTPAIDMSLDGVYAAFGKVPEDHIIYQSDLGLADAADIQVRNAGWQVSNGLMTVEEAIAAFGTLN